MKTLLKIFASIVFFTFHPFLFAQKSGQLKKEINQIIRTNHTFPFNGVILISKNGKTIFEEIHGFKNFEEKIPLKKSNQFEIMSNSKVFTSVLILKEVEKGQIDLQQSIKTYLPEISQTWADSVTVHQLLNHTHGIKEVTQPLLFKPGTEFKYGNYSNLLLGKILENVTQKTYRELATNLFDEIGLNETFLYTATEKHQLVQGYFFRNNSLLANHQTMITEEELPADGIISTASDLAKWNHVLHHGKLLKPETYKLLVTPSTQSQHNVFGTTPQGYAYNIRNIVENQINYIGHTGLGDGFSSLNIYFPKTKISLIVLQNIMPENSDDYYFYEKQFKNLILNCDLVK
ncbi:beta-lactamase family protein [Empedobacter brevis]|uniref:serine hydrolase domain-containing protein n=1 Tax=Empedobacter brevis TaxID=247 RepID=UPI00123D307A|nr:serine hydrolase domain-containing protein [Empedobacter brevis]QES91253.1 beta-lactamase family protein [Empedobacter brevis]